MLKWTKDFLTGGYMYSTIKKWGDSNGTQIPKEIHEGPTENDVITMRRVNKKHKKMDDCIVEFSGEYNTGEWDTGDAKGKEEW